MGLYQNWNRRPSNKEIADLWRAVAIARDGEGDREGAMRALDKATHYDSYELYSADARTVGVVL